MWRAGFIGLCVYLWGAPGFDGTRPAPIDRAVKSLHADINSATTNLRGHVSRVQNSQFAGVIGAYRNGTDVIFGARSN
jgi:hypothetical protein